jgi:putative transposase
LDDRLTPAERGRLVGELAATDHPGVDGRRVRRSRTTIYRWLKDYREGGFDALLPASRQRPPSSDAGLLELAVNLKRENPRRPATLVWELLATDLADRGQDHHQPNNLATAVLTTYANDSATGTSARVRPNAIFLAPTTARSPAP